MFEVSNNLESADVCSNHAGQEANYEDDDVLQGSVEEDRPGLRVPMCGRVDEGWGHEGEGGHLDSPQQRDEEIKPGHRGCQANC